MRPRLHQSHKNQRSLSTGQGKATPVENINQIGSARFISVPPTGIATYFEFHGYTLLKRYGAPFLLYFAVKRRRKERWLHCAD
jgi:hypothetical protein